MKSSHYTGESKDNAGRWDAVRKRIGEGQDSPCSGAPVASTETREGEMSDFSRNSSWRVLNVKWAFDFPHEALESSTLCLELRANIFRPVSTHVFLPSLSPQRLDQGLTSFCM